MNSLNSPPETRENTHALTASEKPNAKLIYSSCSGEPRASPVPFLALAEMFATCVPAKAKKRNRPVPMYSPRMATMWPRMGVGMRFRVRVRVAFKAVALV